MAIPTFEILNKNIMEWVQKNFDKAMLPYNWTKATLNLSIQIDWISKNLERKQLLARWGTNWICSKTIWICENNIPNRWRWPIIWYSVHKSSVTYWEVLAFFLTGILYLRCTYLQFDSKFKTFIYIPKGKGKSLCWTWARKKSKHSSLRFANPATQRR